MSEPTRAFSKEHRASTGEGKVPGSARAHAEEVRRRGATARQHAESVRKASESLRESGARLVAIWEEYLVFSSGLASSDRPVPLEFFRRRAELAEQIADAAETFAGYLEAAADRGDQQRRLELADAQRVVAAFERCIATRLREKQVGGFSSPVAAKRGGGRPSSMV